MRRPSAGAATKKWTCSAALEYGLRRGRRGPGHPGSLAVGHALEAGAKAIHRGERRCAKRVRWRSPEATAMRTAAPAPHRKPCAHYKAATMPDLAPVSLGNVEANANDHPA